MHALLDARAESRGIGHGKARGEGALLFSLLHISRGESRQASGGPQRIGCIARRRGIAAEQMPAVYVEPSRWKARHCGILDHIAAAGLVAQVLEFIEILLGDLAARVGSAALDQVSRRCEEEIAIDRDAGRFEE